MLNDSSTFVSEIDRAIVPAVGLFHALITVLKETRVRTSAFSGCWNMFSASLVWDY